jgi:hypothetical protein
MPCHDWVCIGAVARQDSYRSKLLCVCSSTSEATLQPPISCAVVIKTRHHRSMTPDNGQQSARSCKGVGGQSRNPAQSD